MIPNWRTEMSAAVRDWFSHRSLSQIVFISCGVSIVLIALGMAFMPTGYAIVSILLVFAFNIILIAIFSFMVAVARGHSPKDGQFLARSFLYISEVAEKKQKEIEDWGGEFKHGKNSPIRRLKVSLKIIVGVLVVLIGVLITSEVYAASGPLMAALLGIVFVMIIGGVMWARKS